MSNLERLNQDIATLPQTAQQLVIEFVGFLKYRYAPTSIDSIQPLNFQDDPFVGMWSDRPEMQDSTTWVRQIRQQHWQR